MQAAQRLSGHMELRVVLSESRANLTVGRLRRQVPRPEAGLRRLPRLPARPGQST